jgi:hypothetical protein
VVEQHRMDFIKCEPDSDGESYSTSSQKQNLLTDVKEDEDPLFISYPLMKTENEVSFTSHLSTGGCFFWACLHLVHCIQQRNLADLLTVIQALLQCCKNRSM